MPWARRAPPAWTSRARLAAGSGGCRPGGCRAAARAAARPPPCWRRLPLGCRALRQGGWGRAKAEAGRAGGGAGRGAPRTGDGAGGWGVSGVGGLPARLGRVQAGGRPKAGVRPQRVGGWAAARQAGGACCQALRQQAWQQGGGAGPAACRDPPSRTAPTKVAAPFLGAAAGIAMVWATCGSSRGAGGAAARLRAAVRPRRVSSTHARCRCCAWLGGEGGVQACGAGLQGALRGRQAAHRIVLVQGPIAAARR